MKTGRRTFPLFLFAALLLLAGARPLPAATGAFYEKVIDPPRETKVPVGIEHRKGTILWLESQYEPSAKDVADAQKSGSSEKTWLIFRFTYKNDDYISYRVKLQAVIFDENGAVLAEGSRRSSLDAKQQDDTISFPVRVKTADWPKAARVKVLATFLD